MLLTLHTKEVRMNYEPVLVHIFHITLYMVTMLVCGVYEQLSSVSNNYVWAAIVFHRYFLDTES